MVKHFNVIMAGVISGIVALFTSVLGVSGTIIGSVLSSFLYQLLSSYYTERVDEGGLRKPRLANEIVYVFPLVVIAIIEVIFILSGLHYRFDMIFNTLESAVENNLFRLMGIGLILLGIYPFFNSNDIDKRNGRVLAIVGLLLLLRGLMDVSDFTSRIFYKFFAPFDVVFAIFVVLAIGLVIFNILVVSTDLFKSNEFINKYRPRKPHARKIDTSFAKRPLQEVSNRVGYNHPNPKERVKVRIDSHEADLMDERTHNPKSNFNAPSNEINSQEEQQLPVYDEEIILVNNPDDPEHPIKKKILKRVKKGNDSEDDGFQDVYVIDEVE